MGNYCFESADGVLRELNSSIGGLSEREAGERIGKYGLNTFEREKKGRVFKLFLAQFKDVMTLLLIAAAAISAVVSFFSGNKNSLTDTIIIAAIIFFNSLLGTLQQFRADKALEKLKKLSVCQVKVRRVEGERLIDGTHLAVGDIIFLEEGDVVPADCRIIECNRLKTDESALTGESVSVEKNAERLHTNTAQLGDMKNMLFSSTYVVGGTCTAVVTAVGMETETGRIANLLKGGEGQTRLERGLNKLGKAISAIVIAISAIIFLFGLVAGSGGVLQNFMTAIAIAVAAIPEGLPAVVTIIMAFGVQRMSRRSVIIRRLKSVETLGGCTVICTDKTGTLTENKLKVERWESFDEKTSRRALECMLCCSTVKGEKGAYIGDPTEIALRIYADEQGFEGDFTLIDMVPFSSDRKLMSVAANFGGKSLIYVKGGADVLIERCTKIVKGGLVCSLTHEDRQRIIDKNNEMSDESLRVLALACRKYDGQILEYGLTFLGLAGLADGIKPKVKDAVASCKAAGITTKMITGDHVRTAFAIAKKIGIAESFDEVVSGSDLDSLNEEERKRAIVHGKVFARVSPKHKSIIVKTLQSEGEVVAMTGDGVNDAPSIKSADIGIAMGRGGTEVAKSAADMVIADDNFSTIVSAIREGRRISANISKTICFFLSTNLAEVLSILIATLILFKFNFLTSTQLLWLNLITDSFPTLALGVERAERDIMSRPPVPADRVMFSKRSAVFIGVFGAYMTAVTLCAFVAGVSLWGNEVATTVTFLTLSFLELFQALNVRSDRDSIFKVGILSNKIQLLTLVLGVAVNVVLVITPLAAPFSLVKLSYFQWLLVALLSLSIIPFGEFYKLVLNKFVPYICTKSGNKSNKNKGKRYIFNKVNKRA